MTTFQIKELKTGGLALIFGVEGRGVAYEFAQAYLASKANSETGRIATAVGSGLDAVKQRVEGGVKTVDSAVKLTLNAPIVNRMNGLTAEKSADEISAMIFEKIVRKYGQSVPVYFRPFYTELEAESGKEISKIHKARTRDEDSRKYPFRKMDTAIRELGAEYVFEFAKRFEFR